MKRAVRIVMIIAIAIKDRKNKMILWIHNNNNYFHCNSNYVSKVNQSID